MIAKEMGLSPRRSSKARLMDSNLDIAKFAHDLRHEEAIHRKTGRISYRGELDFKNVVDASVVHEAAASLKRSG